MKAAQAIPPARCIHKTVSIRKIATCIAYERAGISAGNCRTYRHNDQKMSLDRITDDDKEISLPHSGKLRLRGIVRAEEETAED